MHGPRRAGVGVRLALVSDPLHALRPNIVVVMADDLGCCDLGAYGNSDAETPHLDALAAASLRHEAFTVAPVCAPTRAGFLTGRHHLRCGVYGVHGGQDYLDRGERTIAEVLAGAGYACGMWGKWHSGHSDGFHPWQRGFAEAVSLRLYRHRDPLGKRNGATVAFPDRWADAVLVDEALAFLDRERARPCFAFLASMTPHGPLDAPADLQEHFAAQGLSPRLALLHAQVHGLDQAIGRLRRGLADLALPRETVFVFLSDNGPAMNENDFSDAERARRNGLGWRGWKGDVWEAGVRSPLFIHWPDRLAPRLEAQPADIHDLFPTFCAWAGAELPADQRPLDGRDLSPALRGVPCVDKAIPSWVHPAFPPYEGDRARRAALDEMRPKSAADRAALAAADQVMALRLGDWKLTRNADRLRDGGAGHEELHHLIDDPCERVDRLTTEPHCAAAIRQRLDAWWEEIRSEERAFLPPQLLVRGQEAVLPASACCWLSATLRNDIAAIEGFQRSGDSARWSIWSADQRLSHPRLTWWQGRRPTPGTQLAVECSGARITGLVTNEGSIQWQDALPIDDGPGTLAVTWLSNQGPAAALASIVL